jgi:hypothetical protein
MAGLDPDFWVMLSAFSIILVHSIFPLIRRMGGRTVSILNSMSSGFGVTHWLVFNTDSLYQYADNLHKNFYQAYTGEFLMFIFLACAILGFLFIHGLDTATRFLAKHTLRTPDLVYRVKLIALFLFNYSASHYIPTSAHKASSEISVYTIDCIVTYMLADSCLSEEFPEQYNFAGRLFSIMGVMIGILSGYFAPYQEHDWFMAFLDSFLMGWEMMLIIAIEFSFKDTARHYWTFLFSTLLMLAFLGSYYYVNWKLLI